MTTKFFLVASCFLLQCLATEACGQENLPQQQIVQQLNGQATTVNWLYSFHNIATVGTPLLHDKWINGWVVTNDKKFDNVPLKYNVHMNELMFKRPQGDSLLAYNEQLSEFGFYVGDKKQKFKKYTFAGKKYTIKPLFCEVIYEGNKVSFLKLYTKEFQKAGKAEAYAEMPTNKFLDETTFFIQTPEGRTEVNRKKKALLKTFADKKALLEKFWDDQKLDIDKDEDLQKFFQYYESLP